MAYIYIYIDLEELIPRLVDEPPNTIIKCSKLEAMYASRGNYIYIYNIYKEYKITYISYYNLSY